MEESKTFIVKLGGSIVVPSKDNIDIAYLKQLKDLIKSFPHHKFTITVGGGYTCRWYQNALNDNGFTEEMMQHEIGVAACNFNAELVRLVFHDIAADKVYMGEGEIDLNKQVAVTGTWVPGASSNADAVETAINVKAQDILNLSNIDYIYTKDPKEFPNAEKIEAINWTDYRNMFNLDRHLPGQHIPIDVIAADLAAKHNIKFYFTEGHNLENLRRVFSGEKFEGTIIG